MITTFDNRDGRVKSIYLTDRNRTIHREIERRVASIENILFKSTPTEERGIMERMLQRLYNNIK